MQLHYADNSTQGTSWGSGNPRTYLPSTENTFFDGHRYYSFDTRVTRTKEGYINATCSDDYSGDHWVIGEWSLSVSSEVRSNEEFAIDGRPDQVEWYRTYWAAQAQTFEQAGGWLFWAWKCNWINGIDEWRWCYKSAVAAGVIPEDATVADSLSPC